MSELIRVYRRKNIFLLLILCVLNISIFLVSYSPEKNITLTGDELGEYIFGYGEFVSSVYENSQSAGILSQYGSGFDAEKTCKIITAYKNLADNEVEYGDNTGIVMFVKYHISDAAALIFMLIIAADFQSERKKGLVNVIRTTVKGRGRLYLYRLVVLAFSAVVVSVFIYGGCLAAVYFRFGNPGLSRSIQSLPEFMQCPYVITIGEYVFRMIAARTAVVFLISFMFFILISVFGTGMAYAVQGLITAAETVLYTASSPVSSFNYFRYINIIAALRFENYYNECYYLNIADHAVPVLYVLTAVFALLTAVMALTGYIIHGRMYVRSSDPVEKAADRLRRITERFSVQRTMPGWELFKVYIKQGGIFFVAGAAAAAMYTASQYNYVRLTDWDAVFMQNEMQGEITDEKLDYVRSQLEIWNNSKDFNTERSYDLNQHKWTQSLQSSLEKTYENIAIAESRIEIYTKTLENAESALAYTERTGKVINFIKPFSYELLLRDDTGTTDMASVFILIGIIGSVSGIYAYDRQNNMKNTVRSSYRGRKRNIFSRVVPVCIICAVFCAGIHFIQFCQINELMGFENLDEPVQSLLIRRNFPLDITIGQYLILLFSVRALAASGIALICCLISRLSPDMTTAAGISFLVLAVPSVIVRIVPGAEFINAVSLLSGAGI